MEETLATDQNDQALLEQKLKLKLNDQLLSLDNLRYHIGSKTILNKINLKIPRLGIHALLGPNGAGKSTLFQMIAIHLIPDEGSINWISENNLISEKCKLDATEHFPSIGFLPEKLPLFLHLTVNEQFRFLSSLQHYNQSKLVFNKKFFNDEKEKLFSEFDLNNFANKRIGILSRGQRQKVALASIFFTNPDVFILDEPFSGLDAPAAFQLANKLKKTSLTKTIIISEHQLKRVEELADSISVIKNGEIIISQSQEELKHTFSPHDSLEISLTGPGSMTESMKDMMKQDLPFIRSISNLNSDTFIFEMTNFDQSSDLKKCELIQEKLRNLKLSFSNFSWKKNSLEENYLNWIKDEKIH